jgi:hypothetical protein
MVLSPGDPTDPMHEPDSFSHEHRIIFLLDTRRGIANTAGFGWQGGSDV